MEGVNVFSLEVEEDLSPVTSSWLDGFLRLMMTVSKDGGDVFPALEKGDQSLEKEEVDFLDLYIFQINLDMVGDGVRGQLVGQDLGPSKQLESSIFLRKRK
ncbi:hypothetical protein Ddye_005357 [Dipteronia dyeriana]|uniref:Uncharacterized protein n=1 Tax=Dipteronia dyeriana TaxID=168575 RepID=A0AAE0CPP0_9ROSI|nr:hypothetical protein Ddye_005357 [Dipteronia dyeriana]